MGRAVPMAPSSSPPALQAMSGIFLLGLNTHTYEHVCSQRIALVSLLCALRSSFLLLFPLH
jgi:hypothetical protein